MSRIPIWSYKFFLFYASGTRGSSICKPPVKWRRNGRHFTHFHDKLKFLAGFLHFWLRIPKFLVKWWRFFFRIVERQQTQIYKKWVPENFLTVTHNFIIVTINYFVRIMGSGITKAVSALQDSNRAWCDDVR